MRYLHKLSLILLLGGIFSLPASLPAQEQGERPLVKIIATGGTIANSPDGRMAVETVLEQIPQIDRVADIDVYDYIRVGSSEITVQNWVDIANLIMEELEDNPDIDGIVVTHGSNTSEETAYFLNLVLDTRKPVVVVAAQRDRGKLSEDGSRNLYDAVRVAGHPQARGRGVMLVVNEMIHYARDVTKTMSHRVETWDSGDLGVLGLAGLDLIRFYRVPSTRHTVYSNLHLDGLTDADHLPRVDVVYTYADAGPEMVQAAVRGGARGIVVAGLPTGSATPAMSVALEQAEQQGVAVIMSHRGGRGRVETGRDFTSADTLTPQKARILLMLALHHGIGADGLQEVFLEY